MISLRLIFIALIILLFFFGYKTSDKIIRKKHRNCAMNDSEIHIFYDDNYKGYIVDCSNCMITEQEGMIV